MADRSLSMAGREETRPECPERVDDDVEGHHRDHDDGGRDEDAGHEPAQLDRRRLQLVERRNARVESARERGQ